MTTTKQRDVAIWLHEVVQKWGSVEWEWVREQAITKFKVSPEDVLSAYWLGYQTGWYGRGIAHFDDLSVSLILGDDIPVELVVPVG